MQDRNPLVLRDYQVSGTEEVAKAMGKYRRVVVVAPTGSGKTIFAANIIVRAIRKSKRVLFMAHRREIIDQTVDKLVWAGVPREEIGVVLSGRVVRPDAPIQVASVQTLRRRQLPRADLIILDEAHHCCAKTFKYLLEQYPESKSMGLTATPIQGVKGYGLREMYDELIMVARPSLLIEHKDKFLLRPAIWTIPTHLMPDLKNVRMVAGEYNEKDLSKACNTKVLVGNLVTHWQTYGRGSRTVIFAVDVAHSMNIVSVFREAGIAAEHLDGNTPYDVRDAILRRLESGETQVVSNVGVLSEGWDMPAVKTLILARPTKSLVLHLQQCGRILRPFGDEIAVILDHVGNVLVHGPPDFDFEWTLDGIRDRNGPGVKTCPQCYAVVRSHERVCTNEQCGYVFPVAEQTMPDAPVTAAAKVTPVDGELTEFRRDGEAQQRAYWDLQCQIAIRKGYKDGWAKLQFKEKYGMWPPYRFPERKVPKYTDDQKRRGYDDMRAMAHRNGFGMDWVIERFRLQYGEDVAAFKARDGAFLSNIKREFEEKQTNEPAKVLDMERFRAKLLEKPADPVDDTDRIDL